MSTESDESDYLIQYFSKMFQQKLCFEMSDSPQILYIFTMSIEWKDWVKQYFGSEGKIFKRRKNYIILKIITDRVLFHDINENGKNFSIRPTFHFKCQLGQKQENIQYFLGTKFNQKESQSLEFKALKCDLLINNPEIIMKQITSMLNSSESISKIIIGIAFDKEMQSFVVAGCHCSDKKVLLVINAINEACKKIKVSEYVKVSVHDCGAIIDGESRVVTDHKMPATWKISNQRRYVNYINETHQPVSKLQIIHVIGGRLYRMSQTPRLIK
ncbi:hypothetical protein pb186bvf_011391 [Paramecium bursaria]